MSGSTGKINADIAASTIECCSIGVTTSISGGPTGCVKRQISDGKRAAGDVCCYIAAKSRIAR